MNALKTSLGVAILSCGLLSTLGLSPAKAQSPRAYTVIENNTSVPINYQFRWGLNGSWQSRWLEPGRSRWHSITNFNVPYLYVRYDYIGGDGRRVTYKTYRLRSYGGRYSGHGKRYEMYSIGNRIYVQSIN